MQPSQETPNSEPSELKPVFLAEGKHVESVLQESESFWPFVVLLTIQPHLLAIEPQHCMVFCRGTPETVGSIAMHIWETMVKGTTERYPDVMGQQVAIALDEKDWFEYYTTLLRLHRRYGPPRAPLYVKGDLKNPFAFTCPIQPVSDFDQFLGAPTWFAKKQEAREMT